MQLSSAKIFEESSATRTSMTGTLDKVSITALRVELVRRGLPVSGTKPVLIERLQRELEKSPSILSVPRRFPLLKSRIDDAELGTEKSAKRPHESFFDKNVSATDSKRSKVRAVGYLVGNSVWVMGADQMAVVWSMADAYGKGNLSRSAPVYATAADPAATRGRAARQLLAIEKSTQKVNGAGCGRLPVEHLQLTLVEAYHAAFYAKRIMLATTSGEALESSEKVWEMFSLKIPNFPLLFAAYTKYRSTGWMPRSGLKYGVDWVLYPLGSQKHSHAPYCVILSIASESTPAHLEKNWIRLQNKLRLVKNVAKSLIVAEVRFDAGVSPSSSQEAVNNVHISEVTVDRWIP